MKTQRGLIIALGVLVAGIILVVSIHFKDTSSLNENAAGKAIPQKKIQPTVLLKKILDKLTSKTFF